MGQCVVKRKVSEFTNIYSDVEKIIQLNDLADFFYISQTETFKVSFSDINSNNFKIEETSLNLLSLSIYHSSFDIFKFIHTELKASLFHSDQNLQKQGSSLIDLICTRASSEFLDYYLPHHTPLSHESNSFDIADTLNLTKASNSSAKLLNKPKVSLTAIQKACEQGNINIISYVFKYYKDKESSPIELDINYQNEISGENCALISCRKANYVMIKFLHSTCKCNFRLLNKKGENAIQILAASNKKNPSKTFHESFVYLINLTGVDFLYNYEETLLLINCQKTITFFENRLRLKGIEIDKTLIEEKNKIVKVDYIKSLVEEKIESFDGKELGFCSLYEEIMERDDDLSDIGPDNRSETNFDSIIGEV